MRIHTALVTVLASSLLVSSPAFAQQHIVNPAAVRQALADQAATDQQNREVVTRVLQQTQVQELANRLGLNVTGAESAVATLSGAELANLAETARTAEAQLAGGRNTVVISTTALLLIIIIVILIAR